MKLTWKDGLAAALVAAILIPYVGYVVEGEMPFIEDARGMAATGLILGVVVWSMFGMEAFGPRWFAVGGTAVAAALGVTAAVLETGDWSDVALGAFMASIAAMWLMSLYRHAGGGTHATPGRA